MARYYIWVLVSASPKMRIIDDGEPSKSTATATANFPVYPALVFRSGSYSGLLLDSDPKEDHTVFPALRSFCFVIFACSPLVATGADVPLHRQTHVRQPVALATGSGQLFVSNRLSGTISVVDCESNELVREFHVGDSLSDLAMAGESRVLALDSINHQVVTLGNQGGRLHVLQRHSVAHTPINIAVAPDLRLVSIASLWARQVTILPLTTAQGGLAIDRPSRKVLDLPFAPREQWISPDARHLVVADAFGGKLAIVDLRELSLLAIRSIEGHNIRGLAQSHDKTQLHFVHQLLNGHVATHRERVFWGTVLGNVMKSVSLSDLVTPAEQQAGSKTSMRPIAHWSLLPLGEPGNGAGDPGSVVINSQGAAVVALSGVNQVAIRKTPRQPFVRREVGKRPAAIALSPSGDVAYVANRFDDSISVVDISELSVSKTISLGPRPAATLVDHGEQLFHDCRLSLDGWYSCQSCHTDGHTCGLLNDNFGDGTLGAPKRVPSLLGGGQTGPWAWNGSQHRLRDQIHKSITTTMRGEQEDATDQHLEALAAYVRTLVPPPSLREARGHMDDAANERGRLVFVKTGCGDCHQAPTYTTAETYDVGLRDGRGTDHFNPPSLRGVSQRNRYFHDNRGRSLHDVLVNHNHQGGRGLSKQDLADLLEFLNSL